VIARQRGGNGEGMDHRRRIRAGLFFSRGVWSGSSPLTGARGSPAIRGGKKDGKVAGGAKLY